MTLHREIQIQLTVHQNFASFPLVMTAPSLSGPSVVLTRLKAAISFWQYAESSLFSGALRIVMTKMLPSWRSRARVGSLIRGVVVIVVVVVEFSWYLIDG